MCFDDFFFFFFFFFFLFGFYVSFKNISLISSRSFIKGGRKPEYPGENHLTIRKQNTAFPHVTWPEWDSNHSGEKWWNFSISLHYKYILYAYACAVLGPRGWQNMELSWIHGITESSEKSTEMSVVLDYSHPNGPQALYMELTKHKNIGTVASSKLYLAFPFTLCRGVFIPSKFVLYP